jgi:hypothetical protein
MVFLFLFSCSEILITADRTLPDDLFATLQSDSYLQMIEVLASRLNRAPLALNGKVTGGGGIGVLFLKYYNTFLGGLRIKHKVCH